MTDIIVTVVLAVILFAAARYLYRAKKRGAKCVGCPSGGCCGKSGGECHCTERK